MKIVLVTGAYGFLGRYTSALFKRNGFRVIGLGHGHWDFERPQDYGIDQWIEAGVDFSALNMIEAKLDCVVHCAGGSSVGYSVEYPLEDFERTVSSSIALLEYVRTNHPKARFIYPSSAAVYGNVPNVQIGEEYPTNPVSPYGYYKRIVEQLCLSYLKNYNLKCCIIRFFSIYGEGLKKQLLWDACKKISSCKDTQVQFFGSGAETRDWIHVTDAAGLIYSSYVNANVDLIINGGGGQRVSNVDILQMLTRSFAEGIELDFIGQCKEGDPNHYWADISKAGQIGWEPRVSLESGVKKYVEWYKRNASN